MKVVSYPAFLAAAAAVVMVMILAETNVGNAASCNPTQLSPCLPALNSPSPPSQTCCSNLRAQKSCLCGYLKDPNLKQYVNSPSARKVANACGVALPTC